MNVSTVFPEGYVENDRVPRHASSISKRNEERSAQERYQREFTISFNFARKMKKKICILMYFNVEIRYISDTFLTGLNYLF